MKKYESKIEVVATEITAGEYSKKIGYEILNSDGVPRDKDEPGYRIKGPGFVKWMPKEDFDIFKVPVLPRIGEKMEWCGYKDEPVLKTYKGKPYSALVMDYVDVYTVVDIIYQWENLSDEDDCDMEEEFHIMVMVERTKGRGLKACLESDNEFKLESLQDRAVKFAMFVNGVFDRSTIMHPINGKVDMFKMDESPIRIIYDAEPSLGDGRLSFREYVKEVNSTISEGSRIFLAKQPSREEKGDRLLKFYANEFNMPDAPEAGVYQVHVNKHETYRFQQWKKKTGNEDAKQLCIKYKPGGSYYSNWNGDGMKRKNSVTWLIDVDHDEILNYDNVSFEEIDYYLQSRIHRSEYMYMFRALIGLRDRLRKEKEGEKDFIALLAGWSHSSIEKVEELVTWWKLKNKWKRSLSSDDAKAYRMILRKLKNEA